MIEFDNVKIFTDNIDETALNQIKDLVKTEVFKGLPIRIMPDVHAGCGEVIGFTVPVKDKIIPNIVGVDIACGMLTARIDTDEIDFKRLDEVIRRTVPNGQRVHDYPNEYVRSSFIDKLKCKDALHNVGHLMCSLGTLGGGNHFIEVDKDEGGKYYLIIHTGSRNLGKQVAEYYQRKAIDHCKKTDTKPLIAELKRCGLHQEISGLLKKVKESNPDLPPALCYLEGQDVIDYLHDVYICTQFALENRFQIAQNIMAGMGWRFCWRFTTLHNYIDQDATGVYIRKGAIAAYKGEPVLIPLNMRDGCILGVGKGNPDWNYSAPHGAGRVMSRMQARSELKLGDYIKSMEGIFTTSVNEFTIDEAPFCYKPAAEIIDLVKETVDIQHILQPVYNFKSSEV